VELVREEVVTLEAAVVVELEAGVHGLKLPHIPMRMLIETDHRILHGSRQAASLRSHNLLRVAFAATVFVDLCLAVAGLVAVERVEVYCRTAARRLLPARRCGAVAGGESCDVEEVEGFESVRREFEEEERLASARG
jgi:hypothetical protein